jgi:thiol-disulfide isomerase/thioredoxin
MRTVHSILFFLLLNAFSAVYSQYTIVGHIPGAVNKEIVLSGFKFEGDNTLGKAKTDAQGRFSLVYPAGYVGAGLLEIKEAKSVILMLNKENFEFKWGNLEDFSTLTFEHSPENTNLSLGLSLYQKIESKKAGLTYLIPLYADKPPRLQFFKKELNYQKQAFAAFTKTLPKDLYVGFYIKIRKLISDMPMTASRYPERFSENEKEFNAIDFSDEKLSHSALYKDLFEGYVQLMESYGGADLDKLYAHLNASIDIVIKSLNGKPELLQDMSQYLFNLLEKRSLFPAAQHLALAMLDNSSCQLDEKHQALFEQYRKMAIGKTATDIVFSKEVKGCAKLSDIKAKYTLVVFGASWCNKCTEELPKLKPYYENWKKTDDLEIVFVSLDQDETAFLNFTKDFPWVSSCDYKSWEGQAVKDYCVFATPTMYLLNTNQTILRKIVSADHLDAVLKMYKGRESK